MKTNRSLRLVAGALILVTIATLLIAVTSAPRSAFGDRSVIVSPYLTSAVSSETLDAAREYALQDWHMKSLVGEPDSVHEYLLTRGQWLTSVGVDFPSTVFADRDLPVYVLIVTGTTDVVTPAGVKLNMIEIAVDITEMRFLGGAVNHTDWRTIDPFIVDRGFPDAPPPEVVEAHQFRSTPEPGDVEDSDDLAVPTLPVPQP